MRSNRTELKGTTKVTDKLTHCTWCNIADYKSSQHSLLVRASKTFKIKGDKTQAERTIKPEAEHTRRRQQRPTSEMTNQTEGTRQHMTRI